MCRWFTFYQTPSLSSSKEKTHSPRGKTLRVSDILKNKSIIKTDFGDTMWKCKNRYFFLSFLSQVDSRDSDQKLTLNIFSRFEAI